VGRSAGSNGGTKLPVVALRYLLDSNILSEPVRAHPSALVVERLEANLDECATAATVLHELEFGIARLPASRRKTVLTRYLDQVVGRLPILPYDADAARWHARERARLSKRGKQPAFVDGQIAAVANAHGLVVVTRNVPDFSPFEGLAVENWF
jgi:tRNA(fMet)-specific endonuclease VapC